MTSYLGQFVKASDRADAELRAFGALPSYQHEARQAEIAAAADRARTAERELQEARAAYLVASPEQQHEMEAG
jgi:hypothetical protein